jgi:UDP-N-acetylglucosamine 3-dehydrogenase
MVRIAVIGIGSMGRNHARVYHELGDSDLVAISDTDFPLVSSVAESYSVPAFSDYVEMLKEIKPDAVSIAVPTAYHEEVAMAALEAGSHVLIEKPITATLQEGQRIIDRAKQSACKLMIGHIVRFNPAIQELKRRLQNEELGRIFQIVCRRVGPFPERIRDVGVVIDLATHDLDLMCHLTGSDPIRVYAETEKRINTNHEDLVVGLLRFPGSITGALEINWLTPTKVREVLVLGERGLFRVDDLTQDLFFYENADIANNFWPALQTLKGVSEGCMTRYAIQRYEPLKAELRAFLTAIQQDSPVPVSGEEGLAALNLALCLVESGRSHQVIEIAHEIN